MKEEIQNHIKALSEWVAENTDNRSLILVCAEKQPEGMESASALMGNSLNIAYSLAGVAGEKEDFKGPITIAAGAIKNPDIRAFLSCTVFNSESGPQSTGEGKGKDRHSVPGALATLLRALADKVDGDENR